MAQSTRLRLSKHEGAGNDFLVYADVAGATPLTESVARRLCDRRLGVGADGLIRIGPGRDGTDLSMQLRNADGGPAETSGNGLRCLAQAAVDLGLVSPVFTVATDAGVRRVEYTANGSARTLTWMAVGRVRSTWVILTWWCGATTSKRLISGSRGAGWPAPGPTSGTSNL
jgi:diaminopimelate epimerase